MATISKADTDEVKARHQLSAIIGRTVKLRKAGNEYVGLCPYHSEKSPSFRVNDSKGLFHCFGCGASGDIFKYLMDIEGLPFREAFAALADAANLPTVDPKQRRALGEANRRHAAAVFARDTALAALRKVCAEALGREQFP